MKAVVVTHPHEIKIKEVKNLDKPLNDEVIVKIKSAGICGSDMHIYNGKSAFAVYPNIMGHELAGEISEIGSDVTDLKKGDRVVINNVVSCGECYACSIGRSNVCKDVKVLGVHIEGGYKEYVKVKRDKIYKISNSITWEQAALVEPYSIAAQTLDRGRLVKGDKVLICGAGPLGLMILQAAKREKVDVAVLDIVDERLKKAKELGADLVINSLNTDVTKEIMSFTNGEGASLIVECTGNLKVFELCVEKLASQAGRLVVLGFPKEKANISPFDIMRRELEIIGSRLNNNKFPIAIKWMENREVDVDALISNVFPFEKVEEAMKLINEKPEEILKVVLTF